LAADSRFELVRRGYDPQAVDREIKVLNAEIVRLQETSSELAEQLKTLNQRLAEAEQEIGLRAQPSYSALGTKAANLLSGAEEMAIKLTQDAKNQAEELIARTEAQLAERVSDLEQRYEEQLASARCNDPGLLESLHRPSLRVCWPLSRQLSAGCASRAGLHRVCSSAPLALQPAYAAPRSLG